MLKKTITYVDYDGNERTEDKYFNLSKAELMEMQLSENGGLDKVLEKMIAEQDNAKLAELFKKIITLSYGEKSIDGKRFIKKPELTEEFLQTEAYSVLFMELITSTEEVAEFIKGVLPKDLQEEAAKIDAQKTI